MTGKAIGKINVFQISVRRDRGLRVESGERVQDRIEEAEHSISLSV
jgi:hypothetical protein